MLARVAITGIGVVSPAGPYPGPFFENLLAGKSGTRAIGSFDASAYPCRVAAPVSGEEDLSPADAREAASLDRTSWLALLAARRAALDARLEPAALERAATIIGSGFGCIGTIDEAVRAFYAEGLRGVKTPTIPKGMANAPAAAVSMRLKARGPHWVVASACASGTMAIGQAFRLVRDGVVPAALAGGADAPIIPSVLAAWCAMRVVTRRNDTPESASRPFSADRDGLVLGEGAGVFVLEDLERARARGARIHGEVLGFGESSDAGHITAPSLEGEVEAIARALADARVGPEAIDYVNAHGTATSLNDRTETAALKVALGERARAIPVSATKSMLGHSIGASGAIEAAATVLSLAEGAVHPTANFTARDIEGGLDLDYVIGGARRGLALRAALKTSFAFGGANAALVLGSGRDQGP